MMLGRLFFLVAIIASSINLWADADNAFEVTLPVESTVQAVTEVYRNSPVIAGIAPVSIPGAKTTGSGTQYVFVAKYQQNAVLKWTAQLAVNPGAAVKSVVAFRTGEIFVAWNSGTEAKDTHVSKFSANGDFQWTANHLVNEHYAKDTLQEIINMVTDGNQLFCLVKAWSTGGSDYEKFALVSVKKEDGKVSWMTKNKENPRDTGVNTSAFELRLIGNELVVTGIKTPVRNTGRNDHNLFAYSYRRDGAVIGKKQNVYRGNTVGYYSDPYINRATAISKNSQGYEYLNLQMNSDRRGRSSNRLVLTYVDPKKKSDKEKSNDLRTGAKDFQVVTVGRKAYVLYFVKDDRSGEIVELNLMELNLSRGTKKEARISLAGNLNILAMHMMDLNSNAVFLVGSKNYKGYIKKYLISGLNLR